MRKFSDRFVLFYLIVDGNTTRNWSTRKNLFQFQSNCSLSFTWSMIAIRSKEFNPNAFFLSTFICQTIQDKAWKVRFRSVIIIRTKKNAIVAHWTIINRCTTLAAVLNSTLDTIVSLSSIMNFNSNSDVFFDFDPKLFQQLIDQLREESVKNISYLWRLHET